MTRRSLAILSSGAGQKTLHQDIRTRDIEATRWFLQGQSLEEIAQKQGCGVSRIAQCIAKIIRLTWFRSKDRKGVSRIPTKTPDIYKNAAYWLQQVDDNIDALQELDPNGIYASRAITIKQS